METNTKRRRNALTVEEKLELISDSEKGNSVANLALNYKVGEQTARDILKKKI